jgi:microcystin-dependent protein
MPYLTGFSLPPALTCWRIRFPDDPAFEVALKGAILELTKEYNWEQFGSITPAEMAQAFDRAYVEMRQIGEFCMIGCIVYCLNVTPPSNILYFDGQTHLRADYPDLWDVLPNAVKTPTDFTLQDLSGFFFNAAGATNPLFTIGGEAEHTLTVAEMPAHDHSYDQYTFGIDIESVGVPDPTGVGQPLLPNTTGQAGGGQPHENRPPFIALNVGVIAR